MTLSGRGGHLVELSLGRVPGDLEVERLDDVEHVTLPHELIVDDPEVDDLA